MMDVNERNNERIKIAETYFLRAGGGYRMTDHKRNEGIRKELRVTDIQ
jgi:hypothetical protein